MMGLLVASTAPSAATSSSRSHSPVIGEALLHPVSLLCIVLWGLNDHVFKALYGNWLTGKLSDLTGLVAFPLFAFSLWQLALIVSGAQRPVRSRELLAILAGTGTLLAASKLTSQGAFVYALWVGFTHEPSATLCTPVDIAARVQHTQDPTDLIALPMLGVAWWIARRYTA
jgi:hypothetical protein